MKQCFEDLCGTMDRLGVPRESKWRGLIMYMRSIKDYDFLTPEQRERTQDLVMQVLQRKDFSEKAFRELVESTERIINDQWRDKLTEALHDTKQLVDRFQTLLRHRKADVQDLGNMTLDAVQSDQPMEEMVAQIENGFFKVQGLLQKDMETILAMSMTDALTKLNNRASLDVYLERTVRQSIASGSPLSLIFMDIDHFKQFNDTHGHQVGDQALVTVAALLKSFVEYQAKHHRRELYPARYGGEEFALLLPGVGGDNASELANILRKKIEDYNFLIRNNDGQVVSAGIKITISAGVSELVADCCNNPEVSTLLRYADQALYQAKSQGRNRVVRFQPGQA